MDRIINRIMNLAMESEWWKNSGNARVNIIDVVAVPVCRIEKDVCTLSTTISKLFCQNKFDL
jgi:hypothetical protein